LTPQKTTEKDAKRAVALGLFANKKRPPCASQRRSLVRGGEYQSVLAPAKKD
jgi:hypothetical protein